MQDIVLFLIGMAGGFVLATPLGPVNLLCIDRTLARGALVGALSGLGAVAGDLIFGAVAAYGVSFVLGFVNSYEAMIEAVGGLILILFGLRALHSRPHVDRQAGGPSGLPLAIAATFVMTVTNPGALFGLLAFFGSVYRMLGRFPDFSDSLVLILGVGTGSMLWWATLAYIVSHLRYRLSDIWLMRIAVGSGLVLIVFGAVVGLSGVLSFTGLTASG